MENKKYRPNWDEYFMSLAFLVSSRSRDENTKHGSVLVDSNNLIIGTGYNSWIKGIDDSLIPTTRPEKYSYVIHSEINSILNAKISPREAGGARIYVTGQVCNNCFQQLYQAGVNHIIMARRKGTALESEETKKQFDFLVKQTKVKVEYLEVENLLKLNNVFLDCVGAISDIGKL